MLFITDIILDCLFIDIKVKILCFRIKKLGIRNRAVKHSLNTRRFIPAYRGSKGIKTLIGSFQQSGGSVTYSRANILSIFHLSWFHGDFINYNDVSKTAWTIQGLKISRVSDFDKKEYECLSKLPGFVCNLFGQ